MIFEWDFPEIYLACDIFRKDLWNVEEKVYGKRFGKGYRIIIVVVVQQSRKHKVKT